MSVITRVLAATDLTPKSFGPIRYAVATAGQVGGSVVVLHAAPSAEIHVEEMTHVGSGGRASLERELAGRLDRHVTEACGGAIPDSVELVVRFGDPAMEVSGLATEAKCDLIAVAVENRSRVGKLLFGSHAQQILLSAPVPVVAVKPGWTAAS